MARKASAPAARSSHSTHQDQGLNDDKLSRGGARFPCIVESQEVKSRTHCHEQRLGLTSRFSVMLSSDGANCRKLRIPNKFARSEMLIGIDDPEAGWTANDETHSAELLCSHGGSLRIKLRTWFFTASVTRKRRKENAWHY